MASHRIPMTIYFKSRGCRVLPVLHGYIPNNPTSDVFSYLRNQMRFWLVKLIVFYLGHYSCITQKPHEHLFQKSWLQVLPVLHGYISNNPKIDVF